MERVGFQVEVGGEDETVTDQMCPRWGRCFAEYCVYDQEKPEWQR